MRIQDKQKIDRPREKLASKGAAALTDLELIQAIIGSGNKQADVTKISRKLHKVLAENDGQVSYDDLYGILGMGIAKTAEVVAALELARRFSQNSHEILDSPEKVANELANIRDKKQEYFVLFTLDGANRLI
ncbi:hypothetical protein LJC07_05040, partial [Christensenellaceae bacterium OttesenSCG-928-L17]|nr:hypothetical protein [Christensenellaceae bacterium OttesenSCG-928-L17]